MDSVRRTTYCGLSTLGLFYIAGGARSLGLQQIMYSPERRRAGQTPGKYLLTLRNKRVSQSERLFKSHSDQSAVNSTRGPEETVHQQPRGCLGFFFFSLSPPTSSSFMPLNCGGGTEGEDRKSLV